MKNIIIYFGSFDPIHKGHIAVIENAIKKVNAEYLYIGLNKNSPKGILTPMCHRKKMVKIALRCSKKCKILPFFFDYKNIEETYKNIFSLIKENCNYYILIGEDQLKNIDNWHNINLIKSKFKFIVSKRNLQDFKLCEPHDKLLSIDNNYSYISSEDIRKGNYEYTLDSVKNYIINNNLYLKKQIKDYLTDDRYQHVLSTAKTALAINKKANLGLDDYVVEKAALLHDIAKDIKKSEIMDFIKEKYPNHINESPNILHQYVGEYIARENFYIDDLDILNSIKFHTTGRANMSLLEKLIFMSDKIEPLRKVNTKQIIDKCIKNFENEFIEVLIRNKKYLESKSINIDSTTKECYDHYLKNY